ncbi:agmatinase [Citrobacter koseri]|uniref:Agmatinase n=1 Tax=Citrobacter koseri TaxID=545 RepID=A0A2X2YGL0_CITKO|nr:agmatinase [Citrobacter koseri]
MRERLNVVDCGDLVYAFGDAREMSEKLQAACGETAVSR